MSDPKAPLYVEMDDLVPDFETASSLIREAGAQKLIYLPKKTIEVFTPQLFFCSFREAKASSVA